MKELSQSVYLLQKANESLAMTDKSFLLNVPKMPKIKDICISKEYEVMIGVIFTDAAALGGVTTQLDKVTATDLKRLVETKYRTLSIFEIHKAFENERYNVYDTITKHYNYFNSTYVSQVLDKYILWKREKMTDYKISLAPVEKVELLPPPDERCMMIDAVNNAYAEYLETDNYTGICVHLFEFLVKENIIITNSDDEAHKEYFAKKYYIAKKQLEIEASGSNADRGKMRKAREVLKHINDTNQMDRLNATVMRLVILDMFKKRKKEKVIKFL